MESVYHIGPFSQGKAPHGDIRAAGKNASYDISEPVPIEDQCRDMLGYAVNIPYEGLALQDVREPYHQRTQSKKQSESGDDILNVRRLISQKPSCPRMLKLL